MLRLFGNLYSQHKKHLHAAYGKKVIRDYIQAEREAPPGPVFFPLYISFLSDYRKLEDGSLKDVNPRLVVPLAIVRRLRYGLRYLLGHIFGEHGRSASMVTEHQWCCDLLKLSQVDSTDHQTVFPFIGKRGRGADYEKKLGEIFTPTSTSDVGRVHAELQSLIEYYLLLFDCYARCGGVKVAPLIDNLDNFPMDYQLSAIRLLDSTCRTLGCLRPVIAVRTEVWDHISAPLGYMRRSMTHDVTGTSHRDVYDSVKISPVFVLKEAVEHYRREIDLSMTQLTGKVGGDDLVGVAARFGVKEDGGAATPRNVLIKKLKWQRKNLNKIGYVLMINAYGKNGGARSLLDLLSEGINYNTRSLIPLIEQLFASKRTQAYFATVSLNRGWGSKLNDLTQHLEQEMLSGGKETFGIKRSTQESPYEADETTVINIFNLPPEVHVEVKPAIRTQLGTYLLACSQRTLMLQEVYEHLRQIPPAALLFDPYPTDKENARALKDIILQTVRHLRKSQLLHTTNRRGFDDRAFADVVLIPTDAGRYYLNTLLLKYLYYEQMLPDTVVEWEWTRTVRPLYRMRCENISQRAEQVIKILGYLKEQEHDFIALRPRGGDARILVDRAEEALAAAREYVANDENKEAMWRDYLISTTFFTDERRQKVLNAGRAEYFK